MSNISVCVVLFEFPCSLPEVVLEAVSRIAHPDEVCFSSTESRQCCSTLASLRGRIYYVRIGGVGARLRGERYKARYSLRPQRLQGDESALRPAR